MKQTASILLASILAFNWFGYRFVSNFLERRADLALEKRIDNSDYNEATLIEIRIPLNAPYLTGNSTEFERFTGEVELKGIHYKYVKRKIVDGELVLLCLPNENKTRFQNLRVDFFKLVNDINNSSQTKHKGESSFKAFITEYKQENNSWTITTLPFLRLHYMAAGNSYVAAGYASIPKQPPRI